MEFPSSNVTMTEKKFEPMIFIMHTFVKFSLITGIPSEIESQKLRKSRRVGNFFVVVVVVEHFGGLCVFFSRSFTLRMRFTKHSPEVIVIMNILEVSRAKRARKT